jgi:hypothetical protein
MEGSVEQRMGNLPHGCYPCRGEGEAPGHVTIAFDGEAAAR